MAKIIHLEHKTEEPPDNVITLKPLEFRKAYWETTRFIQMRRSGSAEMERHHRQMVKQGDAGIWQIPPHFALTEGMGHTIRAMYVYRAGEKKMREVYYLMGLVDCMINQVNPILRTDLIRAMYREVFKIREDLKIHWYGPITQILLPIDSVFYNESEYKTSLTKAETMQDLFRAIREGTDEMFDILSLANVFYCPTAGVQA